MRENNFMKDIVIPTKFNDSGITEKIIVMNGPYTGKTFEAKKAAEIINNKLTTFYHVIDSEIKTFFLEKDVQVLK